jgi:hypothetical protein
LTALTDNARAFQAANAKSPVVSGAARHRGAPRPENVIGSSYTLENGDTFTLSVAECRSMPMPRWKGVA